MALRLYGIKHCGTVKKARAWLDERAISYTFHDYKTAGIERSKLEGWAKQVGWERLLNRNGLTFKKLPTSDKEGLDLDKAVALMIGNPSMIKRPVAEAGDELIVGFAPERYAALT